MMIGDVLSPFAVLGVVILVRISNVRYWHEADIAWCCKCLLLTQSGHSRS